MTGPRLRLYHHWRSSASWRVRWALALKGVPCDYTHVNIALGETETPEHLARNPLGYVPVLEIDGVPLLESIAIIEWLEETQPEPRLLPGSALERATIRQLAEIISADTHPLQNLSAQELHSPDPEERKRWARHWIRNGLSAYETIARRSAGIYSVGDSVTLADLCLVPQAYNAERYGIALSDFPTIERIHARATATEACRASAPERYQPQQ